MKEKYTLKTIKQTKCYKANIDAIKAIYPDHVEDFARELMIAANHEDSNFGDCEDIEWAFRWYFMLGKGGAWGELYYKISRGE